VEQEFADQDREEQDREHDHRAAGGDLARSQPPSFLKLATATGAVIASVRVRIGAPASARGSVPLIRADPRMR
jgi:hypothetical protein